MADESGKTEKASPQKKQDERKKGNIFQSKDMTAAVSLLATVFTLRLSGSYIFTALKDTVKKGSLQTGFEGGLSTAAASKLIYGAVYDWLRIVIPVCVTAAVVSVIVSGAQTRFSFTADLLKPKLSRLDPVAGIKKMFSMKAVVELIKSFIKLTVIASVLYGDIRSAVNTVVALPFAGTETAFKWMMYTAYNSVMKMAALMAGFGIADYMYQWWSYEKSIRMTKQEQKEEYKRMEGDPRVKGRIRDIQRKMAAMRMMKKVPQADIVIKNPTHFAVALKYDPKTDSAPIVLAKGQDFLALRIIKTAEEHGVYIVENRPLARGLYEAVEVNHRIPEQFYKAVAELIAYMYRIKGNKYEQK
ncbi:MAG: flagellar biosynthesis protein FlhB [Clostridiaceae bacterium]|nr:flagellar biosynthesis protein FlhB [Clostridiaceae bacterium]